MSPRIFLHCQTLLLSILLPCVAQEPTVGASNTQPQVQANVKHAPALPSIGVDFAKNLLLNGNIEEGEGNLPAHWTFIGKTDKDWTAEQTAGYHLNGRPDFNMGRARGEWLRGQTYMGNGALLLESMDPPLSKNTQWHGRNPVDGYWLSDPMLCAAGQAYVAAGWLHANKVIDPKLDEPGPFGTSWLGPLELRFYDSHGKQLPPKNFVRSGMFDRIPTATWIYGVTMPHVAPDGAVTMRLRFGHEYQANQGGWGTLLADNLVVWALPKGAPIPEAADVFENTRAFALWFRDATAKVKPPYLSSPDGMPSSASCWGTVENVKPGNLYDDASKPVALKILVTSLCGEDRKIALRVVRTDWVGNAEDPITEPAQRVSGFDTATFDATLPPTRHFGAFYLDIEAVDSTSGAVIGTFSGRYAVLPPLTRPRTAANIWGVTLLTRIYADGRLSDRVLARMLKVAGFGIGWVRVETTYENFMTRENIETAGREIAWYRNLGMRCVLQIFPGGGFKRPIDPLPFKAGGQRLAEAFKEQVAAIGNWGIEQSNHRTLQNPGYRPLRDGTIMSDEEYDIMATAIHDGIRSAAPDLPVLIGNLATELPEVRPAQNPGNAIERMYGPLVNGKFEGAILNTYWGEIEMMQNSIALFDKHGDTHRNIWQEENMDQRSPFSGDKRRYEEGKGAENLVRWRVGPAAKLHGRIESVTMWGFVGDNDWSMVASALQPRPQFVAQAVMADALADAGYVADRSTRDITLYEWRRGDGPLLILWGNSGNPSVTLRTSAGVLTRMDIMGNCTTLHAVKNQLTLNPGSSPIYLFGGGVVGICDPVAGSPSAQIPGNAR